MHRRLFVLLLVLACLSFGAVTFVPASAPPAAATPTPLASPVEVLWKMNGSPNDFSIPTRLAVDQDNNLYVLDAGNNRVQKFDSDGSFLLMWGTAGDGDGEFNLVPVFDGTPEGLGGIDVDSAGNVYVADIANHRIQKFDSEGHFLLAWGSEGQEDGQFILPHDVAIDAQDEVYVADFGRGDIQKFDAQGGFIARWNGPLTLAGIAIDALGNVYNSDYLAHRVQKFDSDGNILLEWGRLGKGDDELDSPCDIAVDAQGYVYVTNYGDAGNWVKVQKFSADGEFLVRWGSKGTEDGQFLRACGIAVDGDGAVYVADKRLNTVQKFRLTTAP